MARRSRFGRLFWSVFSVVVFVGVVRTCLDEETDTATVSSDAATEAPAYYQSEVEEGLGAAVAIVVDTSGSMSDPAPGDSRPKYVIVREALLEMLKATDSFVAKRPDFAIKVTVFGFASAPWQVLPVGTYNREAVLAAVEGLPGPGGGTAIGEALLAARAELYRSGVYRKYILVLTDGMNTVGTEPEPVARTIFEKSQRSVPIYFVAFNTNPATFGFLKEVGGDVLPAKSAPELQAALKEIYEGKILAEAADYGEGKKETP
jgi:Mg-chelatase subunit ChlD